MDLKQLVILTLQVSVVSTVFGFGLKTTRQRFVVPDSAPRPAGAVADRDVRGHAGRRRAARAALRLSTNRGEGFDHPVHFPDATAAAGEGDQGAVTTHTTRSD